MKHNYNILRTFLLIFLTAASYFCISTPPLYAETLTAEVTAWNKAELTGDITGLETAMFVNSYHSKGNVRKGDTARLEIAGLPKCYVKKIEAWVKSNKNSGAGDLTVKAGSQTILTRNGDYNKWSGTTAYSTDYLPFSINCNQLLFSDESITLTLIGTTNSLALNKLVITYEATAPEPYCVSFQTTDGIIDVCEKEAGAGVVLPNLKSEMLNIIADWELIGWSRTEISGQTTTQPHYYKLNETFYPQKNITLYPVYRQSDEMQAVEIDRNRQDGEYVIARHTYEDNFGMFSGSVTGGYVYSSPCNISYDQDSTAYLYAAAIPAENRYRLDFENDSVSIYNIATESYIGYGTSRLQSSQRKWKVIEQGHNSVFLCCEDKYNGTGLTMDYKVDAKDKDGNWIDVFAIKTLAYNPHYDFLLLFEVSGLPVTARAAQYTSHPESFTALGSIQKSEQQQKTIINGRLYIKSSAGTYDILGNKIQ